MHEEHAKLLGGCFIAVKLVPHHLQLSPEATFRAVPYGMLLNGGIRLHLHNQQSSLDGASPQKEAVMPAGAALIFEIARQGFAHASK